MPLAPRHREIADSPPSVVVAVVVGETFHSQTFWHLLGKRVDRGETPCRNVPGVRETLPRIAIMPRLRHCITIPWAIII